MGWGCWLYERWRGALVANSPCKGWSEGEMVDLQQGKRVLYKGTAKPSGKNLKA